MAKNTERSAAIVTIKDASDMTPEGRQEVSEWLERQAKFLREYGDQFDGTFRARYLYSE